MASKLEKAGKKQTAGKFLHKTGGARKASSKAIKKVAASVLSQTVVPKPLRNADSKTSSTRNVSNLTTDERVEAFRDAAEAERQETFSRGRPVTEFRDGHVVRVWPDGRVENVPAVGHDD